MKEIIAIIRMQKVAETKKALVDEGFNSLTATKVMGRGKMLKDLSELGETELKEEINYQVLESLLKGGRLIPKRLLSIVVKDEEVEKVVETIIAQNKQGKSGDGKIFVLPLGDAMTVRTGQRGEEAI